MKLFKTAKSEIVALSPIHMAKSQSEPYIINTLFYVYTKRYSIPSPVG